MGCSHRLVLGRLQVHLEASRRRRVAREVGELLLLLGGIRDPEIRLRRFAEYLEARSVGDAAWTIACVADRLARRDDAARGLGAGLLSGAELPRLLGDPRAASVWRFLADRRHPAAALLLPERAREGQGEDPPKEPVGWRVSLARQPVRKLIERLLFDPDPRVIRVLLGNPRLTEADVVKLAASRRASPQALEAIAQDGGWVARYPVKLALASNPGTPIRVTLGLLPLLLDRDLRDLSTAGSRGIVRERAAALLAHRGQK